MYSELIGAFNTSLKPNTLDFFRLASDRDLAILVSNCYPFSNDFIDDDILDNLYMTRTLPIDKMNNLYGNSVLRSNEIIETSKAYNITYVYLDNIDKPAVIRVNFRGVDYLIVYRTKDMIIDNVKNDEELANLLILLYEELNRIIFFLTDYNLSGRFIKNYDIYMDMKSSILIVLPFVIIISTIGKNLNDNDTNKIIDIIYGRNKIIPKSLMAEIVKAIKLNSLRGLLDYADIARAIRNFALEERKNNESNRMVQVDLS